MSETTPSKPGIRTTEFWLALAAAVLGVVAVNYAEHQWAGVAGAISVALVSMGYSASRGKVKANGS